jgi:hypothetical protein
MNDLDSILSPRALQINFLSVIALVAVVHLAFYKGLYHPGQVIDRSTPTPLVVESQRQIITSTYIQQAEYH